MKTSWIVIGVIALAVVLIVGAALVAAAVAWGLVGSAARAERVVEPVVASGPERGPGWGGSWDDMPCAEGDWGPGMISGRWSGGACGGLSAPSAAARSLSLAEAQVAMEQYLAGLGYSELELEDVMEFERNFYAIAAEKDTGIGALELLVDKGSGNVGLEPGPNMMWNAKYGMHRGGRWGMMRGYTAGEMDLSPAEAEQIAQRWLDANLPGRLAGEADPFYGYYTLHYLQDGEIEGMLSVHGSSGDIWPHTWHGDFVAMIGE